MIRFMLDSDRLHDLPPGIAPLLATYSDLVPSLAMLSSLQQHHAGSQIILIDRGMGDPTGLASVADVERGAMTVAMLPAWWRHKTAAMVPFLTCYSMRSNLAACDAALDPVVSSHWRWVSTLDGSAVIPGMEPLRRPAAVQCLSAAMMGVHADGSLVLNPGWHPQP